MKASELVYEVQLTEKQLLKDISEIAAKHINALSEKTGLDIDYVHLNLSEVTAFRDSAKKYIVNGVDISTSLPGKIGGI